MSSPAGDTQVGWQPGGTGLARKPPTGAGPEMIKQPTKHRSSVRLPSSAGITIAVLLMLTVCLVPVWNAWSLLKDPNYVYWCGRGVPLFLIGICFGAIVLYSLLILLLYARRGPDRMSMHTAPMVSIFLKLLGVMLMLASVPLARQAYNTFESLMYNCKHSSLTHRTWEVSQVLHQIRQQPDCLGKYSIDMCEGYDELRPFTKYLREMEEQFFCSGFCYEPPPPLALSVATAEHQSGADVKSTATRKIAAGRRSPRNLRSNEQALLSTETEANSSDVRADLEDRTESNGIVSGYPPTLYSQANFRLACEGMAARDVRRFAGDVAAQCFYQGMFMVLVTIVVEFVKLTGVTDEKDREPDDQATR